VKNTMSGYRAIWTGSESTLNVADGSMLLKKDFRSQSEEDSFKNGFLSRILIQISRISDSIIAHRGGFAAH